MADNNPFNMRRFSNIFNPQEDDPLMGAYRKLKFNEPSTRAPSGPTSVEADNDPLSIAIKRLQGGQAASAYREHIGKMPTMEEYAPSKTRRFGGALAAAAASFNDPRQGAIIGEKIIDAPYRNALESWQMKGAGLKEQADIEQDDVKGQIEYIKMIRDQQKNQRDYDLNVRKVDIDEEQATTNRLYREAQIENMQQQGWVKDVDAQGNTVMINPRTNEQKNFGPSIEGRKVANTERGTDIAGFNAQTSRGQLGVSQGNLAQRGTEFDYRMGQDEIQNAARNRQLDISQQQADQSGMNAGSAGFVAAGEQYGADAMAGQAVAREHPEWANWFDADGKLKTPGDFWFHTPNPQDYAAAQAAVEAKKRQILGTRRPGIGATPGRVGPVSFNDLPD